MRKFNAKAGTLDDRTFRDCLCAVGTLSDARDTNGRYFLVGGIAVQTYLPSSCRRPTSDVDLAVLKPLNYDDFKTFSRNVAAYLEDNGYQVDTKKASRAFSLEVTDNEGELNIIEFSRRNNESFKNCESRLQKEYGNARTKLIDGRDASVVVASPEDIAVPKLARSINSFKRNSEFENDVSKRFELSDEEVKARLERIAEFRIQAILNVGDVRAAEELRFVSDIYDMRVLSELVGYNPKVLRDSAKHWQALTEESFERDLLVRSVLPDISLDEITNQ